MFGVSISPTLLFTRVSDREQQFDHFSNESLRQGSIEVIILLVMPSNGALPLCEFDSEDLILKLDRLVDGHVESIEPVVEEIMGLVAEKRCAGDQEFEIALALREALANAVLYGCKNDPDKRIELCVACENQRGILIVVRDPGDGFDPEALPSPVVGQNIYSKGGRGIFLINQLMDEVRFEKGGTEIRMLKRN